MCGIAGILKIYEPGEPVPHHLESIPEAWLDTLDESIKHRGPDGQGRFRDRAIRADGSTVDVAFVHRRLSIIDHAGGHQPMVHDGQRLRPDLTYQPGETPKLAHELCPGEPLLAVVFNGCIYNHRELRAELEAQGHVFETDHSDTEVLVHGWRAWGQDRAEHYYDSGMFADATWDRAGGSVVISRDLFGQKPLYTWYGRRNVWGPKDLPVELVFSSNPRGIYGHDATRRVWRDSIATWITFGHNLGPTPVEHAFELPPRNSYQIPSQTARHSPMDRAIKLAESLVSRLSSEPMPKPLPTDHYRSLRLTTNGNAALKRVDDVDRLIQTCVSERLEADVPVACLLSGGVDSSLISAYAQSFTGNMTTVCVRMPDPRYDESRHASDVAQHLGTDHRTVDVDPNVAEDLIGLIETSGLPFGDSSLLPTFWACRAAAEHASVLLTGDGGDEMFVGYRRYFAIRSINKLWAFGNTPATLTPLRCLPQRTANGRGSQAARFVEALRRDSYAALLAIFGPSDSTRLLGKSRYKFCKHDFHGSAHEAALDDLDWMLPSDYLRKVDLASMSVPVETRAPFLDRRLLYASIQLGSLLHAGGRKALLRNVARKYLPAHIIDRPKQGFAIPVGEWFRSDFGGMRQLLLDHLRSNDPFPGLGDAGVEINMKFVEQMLREHDAAGEKSINPWHGRDHSQRLYMLLVLSIWAKWLDRTRREAIA